MRLLRATKSNFLFDLNDKEKALLLHVLSLYPRVPPAHHKATKKPADREQESQRLLDDALAEQRAANKKILQAFTTDPRRFNKSGEGWHLNISPSEMEWLLQVLNDVNVGTWLSLGSPNPKVKIGAITEHNANDYLAMELATGFQYLLLEALEGRSGQDAKP